MRKPFAAVALLGLVACGSGGPSNPLNPQYQPQITNLTDSFSLQLTGVQNGSASLVYTWQNTGTMASIDRSSSISAGTVTLIVKDAAAVPVEVYNGPLNGVAGSVTTSPAGTPGAWTIEVDFANATGTINFRAQKF